MKFMEKSEKDSVQEKVVTEGICGRAAELDSSPESTSTAAVATEPPA